MDLDVNRRKRDVRGPSRAAALPKMLRPQLATLVDTVPSGAEWLHEIKHDGYRVVCRVERGHTRLYSRNGNELTARMQAIADSVAGLGDLGSAWLDGEVVALSADGRTSFSALQTALSERRDRDLLYYVFDMPYANGLDYTHEPLTARKQRLATLLKDVKDPNVRLRYSDHVLGNGGIFYAEACRFQLEGVVSKRAEGPYRSGRGYDWVKTKCRLRQEFLVCGYTAPRGARAALGAIALGLYDAGGQLHYCGRVGTGFDADALADMRRRLAPLEISAPPFAEPIPRDARNGVTWVQPQTVVEIEFAGWTRDGFVRQGSYQGVRDDKNPREVVREVAESLPPSDSASARDVRMERAAAKRLTHPDRVLYEEQGLTKADLASYYAAVADRMLPRVRDRPLTLVRCPQGRHKHCFFQKHAADESTAELLRVPIREHNSRSTKTYLAIDTVEGLFALVQMGVLEIHVWNARIDKLEFPDQLVLDLDPDMTLPWTTVIEAATLTRARLESLGLSAFVRTTGGKGVHVVVPLVRRSGWDEVKVFAKAIADDLVRQDAARYTTRLAIAARREKILIDYLRNARGATAIASYSTRARPGATVSVPLSWEELTPDLRPDRYTALTVPTRLQSLERDPWADYNDARSAITVTMQRELGITR
ncbi:MAG: DNA ligase D [Sulfurifustis sp.]